MKPPQGKRYTFSVIQVRNILRLDFTFNYIPLYSSRDSYEWNSYGENRFTSNRFHYLDYKRWFISM